MISSRESRGPVSGSSAARAAYLAMTVDGSRKRRWGAGRSKPERIGLRHALRMAGRQRRHGPRLLEPDEGVELLGEHGLEVVAVALGLGTIDDADGPLEAGLGK